MALRLTRQLVRAAPASFAPRATAAWTSLTFQRMYATKRFTEDHEWVVLGDDGIATIGITDHAQSKLGEVVYVDLSAQPGEQVESGGVLCSIESVKAASDVYAPIAGEVLESNGELNESPELINSDPETKGWLVKLRPTDASEVDKLMDKDAYEKLI
ncbi:glycine cleavage H-protein-domain-containing protein [Thamnocephalis sphaerospora]|uniref:Glycine cleavage system H protein n=1 Tax=Thamnocephalis sphaerospora TaxID=78915 RepID=A0A4P9XUR2_9FUNG|nr:glycine cleavage H-protein-domain-containing protein [Thamnocephalis sphaerospora]|eukprot:RKP09712.1 glycine cleavage H-protein-domain-containing protein [Thamnocephalis sphaerospora]